MSAIVQPALDRLAAQVAAFEGRVKGIGALKDVVAGKVEAPGSPAAYVFTTGARFGQAETVAGLFRQPRTRVLSVLIHIRAFLTGAPRAAPEIEALEQAVIDALAGWAPAGMSGDFRLRRSGLVDLNAELVSWQIDFEIDDHVRIAT